MVQQWNNFLYIVYTWKFSSLTHFTRKIRAFDVGWRSLSSSFCIIPIFGVIISRFVFATSVFMVSICRRFVIASFNGMLFWRYFFALSFFLPIFTWIRIDLCNKDNAIIFKIKYNVTCNVLIMSEIISPLLKDIIHLSYVFKV